MKAALPPLIWAVLYGIMVWLSLVPHLITTPNESDKGLHIVAYCMLMLCPAAFFRTMRPIVTMALLLFATGVGMEIMQAIVGGRQSSVYDALANGLGIVLGIITGRLIRSGLEAAPNRNMERY